MNKMKRKGRNKTEGDGERECNLCSFHSIGKDKIAPLGFVDVIGTNVLPSLVELCLS